ncbi:MAG: glycoside hydrolase family 9 protein [Lachnospiraceae bacterium]|nr:glycoside hydrolase family 9 protein [Lachnospiraceae bacterium]
MKLHVNQLGYYPTGIKQAVLEKTDDLSFPVNIKNPAGKTVFSFDDISFTEDRASGTTSGILDFSFLSECGKYSFELSDGTLIPFEISADPNADLFFDAQKMFYFQRCGCELKKEYAGIFTHKACHTKKVKYLYEDREVECSGGWHDAGDYGRYVTAGAVAVGHLLYAYELVPEAFAKSLNIPESGNGIPDILNEVKYELDWFLKMQEEDGSVHHKCTSMRHTDFLMPEDDPLPFIITPISSLATADFAATCALGARIYRKFDEQYAEKLAKAAESAGRWLLNNPGFLFKNPEGVYTGDYRDISDRDERFWAAVELYRLNGDKAFHDIVKTGIEVKEFSLTGLGWEEVGGLGILGILCDRSATFEIDIYKAARNIWLGAAGYFLDIVNSNPFSTAMKPEEFQWGSNLEVLSKAILLNYAGKLSGEKKYIDASLRQLDYILGANPLDQSYVTGYGTKPLMNPHNRPTVSDGIVEPIPGYVSGGPNRNRPDPDAKEQIPEGTAPMKCFIDNWKSYSTNEITIYWNSPLVLLLALLAGEFDNTART